MVKWGKWNRYTKTVGLEINDSVAKLVELRRSNQEIEIQNVHTEPVPEELITTGKIQDEEKFLEFMFMLKSKAGLVNQNVHLAISCQNVLLRPLTIPKLPQKELEKAIKLEIEHNIQLPFEDYVYDFSIITEHQKRQAMDELQIMLVNASKSYITSYVEPLTKLDLVPKSVDLAPLSVLRALEINQAWIMDETFMVVNVGVKSTEVSIVHHGILRMVRTFPLDIYSYLTYKDSLADAYTLLNYQNEQEVLQSFASDMGSELDRVINFYLYTLNNRDQEISQLILVGEIRNLQKLAEYLSIRLNVKVVVEGIRNDFIAPHLIEQLEENAPSFVVPFGLALKDVN